MDTLPLDAFEIPATRVVAGNGVAHPVAAVLINTALPQLAQALDFRIDPQYDSRAVVGTKPPRGGGEPQGLHGLAKASARH